MFSLEKTLLRGDIMTAIQNMYLRLGYEKDGARLLTVMDGRRSRSICRLDIRKNFFTMKTVQ